MWMTILSLGAKFLGPVIVNVAPWIVPYLGWVRPVLRGAAILLLVAGVAYGTYWLTSGDDDTAERTAQCQSAIDNASRVAVQLAQQSDAKAQAAAARARAAMYGDLDEAAQRIADLERALGLQSDDPIVFPKTLTKELRR
jgi:hypothetical protein